MVQKVRTIAKRRAYANSSRLRKLTQNYETGDVDIQLTDIGCEVGVK